MRELERDHWTHKADSPSDGAPGALAIVGAGRVGGAITQAARGAGLEVQLAGREDAVEACRDAEAALLCVPDAAIGEVVEAISVAVPPLRLVGHVSGATRLDVLIPARQRGASTFSIHPLQTVPTPDADLGGAPCAIAGSDAEAERSAAALAERLGMRPFAVPEEHRAAYHAAASIASNFLVVVEESAADLLARAGADDARELLAPLVLRTAANWAERAGEALTGPIARGDEATVADHLEAVGDLAPELLTLYEKLAERTRDLAGTARAEAGA
jgi:predicted short-subunit dehydrogenase-like oxidoreductase (DUF2520 family)